MDGFEDFENVTNSTFEQELTSKELQWDVTREIILAILCIFAIIINVAIIYTIFRYKKLNTVVVNIFIANWSIVDIFILITLRSNFRLIEFLDNNQFPYWFLGLLFFCEHNFRITYLLFVLAVTYDWFLASYFSRASQKFRKYYKFSIAFIWVFGPILLFCALVLDIHLLLITYILGYLGFVIFLIFIYSFIGVQKYRKKSSEYPAVMLKLTTILIICWLPLWCTSSLRINNSIYVYIWPLFEFCCIATCIVTFIVLYRTNKDFQACFQQAIKFSRNRYVDDLSEFQNFPETINNEQQFSQTHNHPSEH